MRRTLKSRYETRYFSALVKIVPPLEGLLRSVLGDTPRIDRIAVRAKTVDRFIAKSDKRDTSGALKYADPFDQIQDQLGARVVVLYEQDVEAVSNIVLKYFRHIEARIVVPELPSEFGYVGKHFVLALPTDALPSGVSKAEAPEFFECQVKTLFQHAWAETEHELGYKSPVALTDDQKRRLAFTAAQAWGADRIMSDLMNETQASALPGIIAKRRSPRSSILESDQD